MHPTLLSILLLFLTPFPAGTAPRPAPVTSSDPRLLRTTPLALEARQIVERSRGGGLSTPPGSITLSGAPLRLSTGRYAYWPKIRRGSATSSSASRSRSSRGFGSRYVIPAESPAPLPRPAPARPPTRATLFPAPPVPPASP